PYVPAYDRAKPTQWRSPVRVSDDTIVVADAAGRVRRLSKQTDPKPRLAPVGEEVDLKASLDVDPAPTAPALVLVTGEHKVPVLAAKALSRLGDAAKLGAPRALGPFRLGEDLAVFDAAGRFLLIAPDGTKRWAVETRDKPPLGAPVLRESGIWLL